MKDQQWIQFPKEVDKIPKETKVRLLSTGQIGKVIDNELPFAVIRDSGLAEYAVNIDGVWGTMFFTRDEVEVIEDGEG